MLFRYAKRGKERNIRRKAREPLQIRHRNSSRNAKRKGRRERAVKRRRQERKWRE